MAKILFVCSSGGHLDQLLLLLPPPDGCSLSIATFDKPDAREKIQGYRVHALAWPTNRNLRALAKNSVRALRVLQTERPDIIVSSGAAAAVPFFYLGKVIWRSRTVFIECIDRPKLPTLTARLIKPVTDQYLCQWPGQLDGFPRRVEIGTSR
ncbi:polysaccharide biosynthesis protein [Rhodococcus opacus]|uniref:Putative polysaccharide biosynthesis protein n=1 Tax=Rhodococcus opacus (strain B4) TaxID=632772 RepID=C1AWI2_RHOOB|nr:putative polysaccharide biosynthesis protein [Rhodococcus opacus B4]